MSAEIEPVPFRAPSLLDRLFRRQPRKNAIAELTSLLRERGLRGVSTRDVAEIEERFGVCLLADFPDRCLDLYRSALNAALTDSALSTEEVTDLSHLRRLLGLGDLSIKRVHDEAAGAIYRSAATQAAGDGQVDQRELAFLNELRGQVQLPDSYAQSILGESTAHLWNAAIARATEDQQLSPDEDAELQAIRSSLGIEETDTDRSRLAQYRLFWRLQNGDLPVIDPGIHLQRGEVCHAQVQVTWYEHRKVTRSVRYSGPTARIRLARGIYWRVGEVAIQRITEDVMKPIDHGTVYLTNKRLIFVGAEKNTNVRLDRVLDFTPYQNGVQIEKDAGKSPFLFFEQEVEAFCMILGRVLVAAQG